MRTIASIVVVLAVAVGCQKNEKPDAPAPASSVVKHASPSTAPAAPKFARFKSADYMTVIGKLGAKNDIMKVDDAHAMTKDDYGMAPMLATEGTRFLVPSLGPEKGGRIMSFSDPDDLAKVRAYYDDMKKASAALFSWTAVKDNLLLQMNGDMPEKQFRVFEQAMTVLDSMPATMQAK